jgi:hypothetical protein
LCGKWRRVGGGVGVDAEESFTCDVLPGGDCELPEEEWEGGGGAEGGEGAGEGGWSVMEAGGKRARFGAWTAADEERRRAGVLREALGAYEADEWRVAECGTDRAKLEALLLEVGGLRSSKHLLLASSLTAGGLLLVARVSLSLSVSLVLRVAGAWRVHPYPLPSPPAPLPSAPSRAC